jgi:hemerythrin superfamily protein
MDAIVLLKKDHRAVERLLERYRMATKGKRAIVDRIVRELSAHMAAEERELYPVLRESIEDGRSLMNDAAKEHAEARGLLAELRGLEEGSFEMDAKVATLRGAIAHHVKDEEGTIFPRAERSLGNEALGKLGTRIARAKKSAPQQPSRSAAKSSPGVSVSGVASAAVDPVGRVLRSAPSRAAKRSRTRRTKKVVSSRRKRRATTSRVAAKKR